MKKIISMLLCVTMMVFALALVSCGDDPHVHQYNRTNWSKDATAHWHAASCECEDAGVVDRAAHSDPLNNGFCEVCGYVTCENTDNAYETTYKYDDDAHWFEPVCGCSGQDAHVVPKKDLEKHTGGSKCTVCGYECTNDKYNVTYTSNETYHWYASVCGHYDHNGLVLQQIEHRDEETYEGSTRIGDGVCDDCGYVMCNVPAETDTGYKDFYASEWSTDGEYHWYEPKCNHMHPVKDYAEHSDPLYVKDAETNEWIENKDHDGNCDVCKKPMAPVVE